MAETPSAAVFAALADPTRRHVLELLGRSGPATATELADEVGVTRQAVAKHLGILAEAGLASATKVGRETRYRADLDALGNVTHWIDEVQGDWKRRLERLTSSIERH